MGRGARAWAEGPGRGQRVGWAEGVEWAEAEDGQKRWVVRVGGLGREGFMRGSEGPGGWQRVGWAEWVVWAKGWAGQRGGVVGLGR